MESNNFVVQQSWIWLQQNGSVEKMPHSEIQIQIHQAFFETAVILLSLTKGKCVSVCLWFKRSTNGCCSVLTTLKSLILPVAHSCLFCVFFFVASMHLTSANESHLICSTMCSKSAVFISTTFFILNSSKYVWNVATNNKWLADYKALVVTSCFCK